MGQAQMAKFRIEILQNSKYTYYVNTYYDTNCSVYTISFLTKLLFLHAILLANFTFVVPLLVCSTCSSNSVSIVVKIFCYFSWPVGSRIARVSLEDKIMYNRQCQSVYPSGTRIHLCICQGLRKVKSSKKQKKVVDIFHKRIILEINLKWILNHP